MQSLSADSQPRLNCCKTGLEYWPTVIAMYYANTIVETLYQHSSIKVPMPHDHAAWITEVHKGECEMRTDKVQSNLILQILYGRPIKPLQSKSFSKAAKLSVSKSNIPVAKNPYKNNQLYIISVA